MEEIKTLKKEIESLKKLVLDIQVQLKKHTHSGQDGSNNLWQNDIVLIPGLRFQTGSFSLEENSGKNASGDNLNRGALVVGKQATGGGTTSRISDGTQLTIEHQPETNESSNQTFFYGFRSPVCLGNSSGTVVSGGTVLTQSEFNWRTNELAGAYVAVINPATPSEFDFFEIASNTENTLTITGGTWSFSGTDANFTVSVPVYLGSANTPWRRLYTMDGIAGGLRFGGGDTNGGQNALLYTDGADLKFRKKDGTITTVTVT